MIQKAEAGLKDDIRTIELKNWLKEKKSTTEIAYRPARVLLQDYTGIPAVADQIGRAHV